MKGLLIKSPVFNYLLRSFEEWLLVLGYSESTVYNLPNHTREFLYYLESKQKTTIQDITTAEIRTYYKEIQSRANLRRGGGLSSAYLNKHLQALTKFCEYLRGSSRLDIDAHQIKWEKKEETTLDILTEEDIEELYKMTYIEVGKGDFEALNARDRAILTVFYGCGLRRNEGVNLDIGDVNFDRAELHVKQGKNYKERLVPIGKRAMEYLQDWVFEFRPRMLKQYTSNAFFVSQQYRRMQGQSIALRLKILQERSNSLELKEKNVHLHVLRHSIATHLLSKGMNLNKISRFLGHSSLESTQIYTHLIEQIEQEK